jgi:deoxyhypusine synthase
MSTNTSVPLGASAAVLKPSDPIPDSAISVEGPDFEHPLDLDALLASYKRIGFQAQSLGRAIEIVNKMVGKLYMCHIVMLTFEFS